MSHSTIIILPYARTSKSAKSLAKALNCRRIAIKRRTYRHRSSTRVINWGSQRNNWRIPEESFINKPSAIARASNKLSCFRALGEQDVPTLEWTTSQEEARDLVREGRTMYARQQLSGHSGQGIIVINGGDQDVPQAPLYTVGLHTWTEWRIHLGILPNGQPHVILIQQKIKEGMSRANSGSDPVRNHKAGYKFRQQDLSPPEGLEEVASAALLSLGLDFGAIDMAHTEEGWKVIEVNTACGLDGTTHEKYAAFFTEYLRN